MAQLTVNRIAPGTALAQTLAAATGGGDSFLNTGKEQVAIKNAGGGSINITIRASSGANNDKCNFGIAGTPGHDIVIAIPNDSAVYLLGPWNPRPYSDGSGLCQLAYSAVTSVTIAVFVAPPAV
jgi:hypothetical protein